MSIQLSTNARNGLLDAIEAEGGASPILKMRAGAVPASCAAADAGAVLATLNLPADPMAAASGGSKAKSGTWDDNSADNTGVVGHFRFYKSDGVTCWMQGTVTATGGGGDMTVDNVNFAAGQAFSITSFTLTAPGA